MKEKLKQILNNKFIRILILLILPIIIEVLIFNKIEINKATIIRIGTIYSIYGLGILYFILNKYSSIIKKITENIIKFRYPIALIILVILVIFKINFSSLDMWCAFLGEPEARSTILGRERSIRSDEWLVTSMINLGQAQKEEGLNIYNENIAGGNCNMIMTAAPVWDITSIAKPFNWGYLLFGTDYGFSFWWCLKIVALVMVSLELILKLSKKDKILSIAGAIILALAPTMMWWLSTAVVEGYILGLAVVVLFGYYMENLEWKLWKKLLIALGMIITIPGFAFTLYPAFQVPFAFLMAIFMINDFVKHRKEIKKTDYLIMGGTIVVILGLIARFILVSWQDIKVMMGTVYPGSRFETGGDYTVNKFISYFICLFMPYSDKIVNPCEPASYIFPFIGLAILIIAYIKNYKKDKDANKGLLLALIILYAFFLLWEFVGVGKIIAKVTFMYFSTTKRTNLITGLIGTILSIMLLKKFEKKSPLTNNQALITSVIVSVLSITLAKSSQYSEVFTPIKLEILAIMMYLITYFLITGNKKAWCYTMCIIAIIAGIAVNPIVSGTKVIYQTEISKEIRKIKKEEKDAIWLGRHNLNGQYLIANGVKCISGVNTYPNFDWLKIVDPEGKYNEVYNRFAHINIILSDKTEFRLLGQDIYEAELTYKNLKDLNVKYYFTNTELTEEIKKEFNISDKYIVKEKNQFIYEIN